MIITAYDFDQLTEVSMEWNRDEWKDRLARFSNNLPNIGGRIYWVENYTNLMLCREFIFSQELNFIPAYDEAMEQWCFVSDYVYLEPSNA